MEIYNAKSIRQVYSGKTVLDVPEFSVAGGSTIGLIGPNGSGKSTLLNLLAFISRPTEGELRYKGVPAAPFSDAIRFRVTLLTQEPYLMKRSVFNNIAYGLKLRGKGNNLNERIQEAMEWVGLDSRAFVHRPWYALSGGEAQRVALAARLVLKPEVLLLDEPTASVDAASAQLIKEATVRACRQWGTTVIVASHDWQWLYEICDGVKHLFRGRIFGTGEENILLGPWRKRGDGLYESSLHSESSFPVSTPTAEDAVAIIASGSIEIGDGDQSVGPGEILVRGIVSRLLLEKSSGDTVATILAGSLPLTIKIAHSKIRDAGIFPGSSISLRYNPEAVRWLTPF